MGTVQKGRVGVQQGLRDLSTHQWMLLLRQKNLPRRECGQSRRAGSSWANAHGREGAGRGDGKGNRWTFLISVALATPSIVRSV